ncbi:MAG: putative ubiquitin-conjugating enzyme E2 D/E [Streblomastix strix]|uniref:Putative ubiquitin-conjugating enzyme E2 D/E n=1 Tax=Streblomastix strix TaxID=222440 RepID=A0A5J4X3V0_9EUKA|nr:MAG: putative ubiquitin-conjugating enzyme E2 D/E [Streblomastix strix]
MNKTTIDRLQKDYASLLTKPFPGVEVKVCECDIMKPWEISFDGPQGTPYEGGKFHMIAKIQQDFPFKPPIFSFTHKIYHCNVLPDGSVLSIDKLTEENWRAYYRISDAITFILDQLKQPDPDHSLEIETGNDCKYNRAEYDRKAREWTKLYAK